MLEPADNGVLWVGGPWKIGSGLNSNKNLTITNFQGGGDN